MRRSCASRILLEIASIKVVNRRELNELCRGSSIIYTVLHYLSKLKLVYITKSRYVILIPWIMYLRELYGNDWIKAFRKILREKSVKVDDSEVEEIRDIVENHPIESLYTFVKVYVRFQDFVTKTSKIPTRAVADYCKHYDFTGREPVEIYLDCIAPLLDYSTWLLQLVMDLIKSIAMHPNPREVLIKFFEVSKQEKMQRDIYYETIDVIRTAVQYLLSIESVGGDLIEKVIEEYSKKMKISYKERSYMRGLLKYIVLTAM